LGNVYPGSAERAAGEALRRAAAQIGYLWFHTGCLEENAAFAARIGCVPYNLVLLGAHRDVEQSTSVWRRQV
jgi:hypothetical protein